VDNTEVSKCLLLVKELEYIEKLTSQGNGTTWTPRDNTPGSILDITHAPWRIKALDRKRQIINALGWNYNE
jgi:hypothetical protein